MIEIPEIGETPAEKIARLKEEAYYCFGCGDEANGQVGMQLLQQAEKLEEDSWPPWLDVFGRYLGKIRIILIFLWSKIKEVAKFMLISIEQIIQDINQEVEEQLAEEGEEWKFEEELGII